MAQATSPIRWSRIVLLLVVVVGLAGAGWYAVARARPEHGTEKAGAHSEGKSAAGIGVDVVKPTPGGVQRLSTQPGTVEPFESAALYAKVSGYLSSLTLERDGKPVLLDGKPVLVDRGTHVNAGDVLARISVPEYEKQVERAEAQVRDSKAKVKQMEAHLQAAQADERAARAEVGWARVMVKAKAAYRRYREKQLERIKALAADKAVDAKLVDEQEDFFLSAQEAENAANEKANATLEQANAAKAKIAQAQADLDEANAAVGIAEAEAEKAKVLLDYTVIRSPYTGVVTQRNFDPPAPGSTTTTGSFIKSADQGGVVPILIVERIDLMRVVVQVPDRDVPYVHIGAPAVIKIDALPNVIETNGKRTIAVSRYADAEDPTTRTMRTEIDVWNNPNDPPQMQLRHGMYGRVTIILSEGAKGALRIPSGALVGKAEDGKGSVRVVHNGKVQIVPVEYASDNGVDIEVTKGLTPNDLVVTRSTGPVENGTPVTINNESGGGH